MKQEILKRLSDVATRLGLEAATVKLEYPENQEQGDFSSNVAMANAKKVGKSPRSLAEEIVNEFKKEMPDFVEAVEVAGPGFINFKIKDRAFSRLVADNAAADFEHFTKMKWSKANAPKVMVEYTDPNPFKVFHIGHLMSNAIGESIARLIEHSGAQVIRACYQGDVGLHVAKTIWAILKKGEKESSGSVTEKVKWLGEMYVYGSQFDEDAAVQKEIAAINKKIFEKSDKEINSIYEKGRKWSLEYFDLMYEKLGTKFDQFFFESEVAADGIKIVREFLPKGIFAESEGAIVFKGEDHGLHTRVFITSQGLPTYEAKELGLTAEKFKKYLDLAESIVITANEQSDYFKVLLKVLSLINPEIAKKTRHISHGILRFASGKMSSRKGNIISADSLLEEIRTLVHAKISDRKFSKAEADEIADEVAVAAIKYTILRSSVGSDIIFDSAASISFEGDSGPYLQYSAVRAQSVLEKAQKEGVGNLGLKLADAKSAYPEKVGLLEKLIARFSDIAERARDEYAPQLVANYLVNLAGAFNSFYGAQIIIDAKDPLSPYRVALTRAFHQTMTDGLWLLGIKVPKKM